MTANMSTTDSSDFGEATIGDLFAFSTLGLTHEMGKLTSSSPVNTVSRGTFSTYVWLIPVCVLGVGVLVGAVCAVWFAVVQAQRSRRQSYVMASKDGAQRTERPATPASTHRRTPTIDADIEPTCSDSEQSVGGLGHTNKGQQADRPDNKATTTAAIKQMSQRPISVDFKPRLGKISESPEDRMNADGAPPSTDHNAILFSPPVSGAGATDSQKGKLEKPAATPVSSRDPLAAHSSYRNNAALTSPGYYIPYATASHPDLFLPAHYAATAPSPTAADLMNAPHHRLSKMPHFTSPTTHRYPLAWMTTSPSSPHHSSHIHSHCHPLDPRLIRSLHPSVLHELSYTTSMPSLMSAHLHHNHPPPYGNYSTEHMPVTASSTSDCCSGKSPYHPNYNTPQGSDTDSNNAGATINNIINRLTPMTSRSDGLDNETPPLSSRATDTVEAPASTEATPGRTTGDQSILPDSQEAPTMRVFTHRQQSQDHHSGLSYVPPPSVSGVAAAYSCGTLLNVTELSRMWPRTVQGVAPPLYHRAMPGECTSPVYSPTASSVGGPPGYHCVPTVSSRIPTRALFLPFAEAVPPCPQCQACVISANTSMCPNVGSSNNSMCNNNNNNVTAAAHNTSQSNGSGAGYLPHNGSVPMMVPHAHNSSCCTLHHHPHDSYESYPTLSAQRRANSQPVSRSHSMPRTGPPIMKPSLTSNTSLQQEVCSVPISESVGEQQQQQQLNDLSATSSMGAPQKSAASGKLDGRTTANVVKGPEPDVSSSDTSNNNNTNGSQSTSALTNQLSVTLHSTKSAPAAIGGERSWQDDDDDDQEEDSLPQVGERRGAARWRSHHYYHHEPHRRHDQAQQDVSSSIEVHSEAAESVDSTRAMGVPSRLQSIHDLTVTCGGLPSASLSASRYTAETAFGTASANNAATPVLTSLSSSTAPANRDNGSRGDPRTHEMEVKFLDDNKGSEGSHGDTPAPGNSQDWGETAPYSGGAGAANSRHTTPESIPEYGPHLHLLHTAQPVLRDAQYWV